VKADSKFNRIIVDLDSILDIRQGVLGYLLDEEQLGKFIASTEYNFRSTDDFSSVINMGQYNVFNKERTRDLISKSTVNSLFTNIKNKVITIDKRNAQINETKKTEIIINIYPFQLTNDEQTAIIDVMFTKLETNVFITTAYLSPKDLTPNFLVNMEVCDLYIYDTSAWLNSQLENIKNYTNKLHSIKIHFPAISKENITTEMKSKIDKSGFNDIYSFIEYILSEKLSIEFIPSILYNNIIISKAYMEKFNKDNSNISIKEMFKDSVIDSEYSDLEKQLDEYQKKKGN